MVVFHDGERWRAAVDTAESGDLTAAVAMADYRVERQFGYLGGSALLSYAVNIYSDGNVCSLVTNSGSHGSHVAGYAYTYRRAGGSEAWETGGTRESEREGLGHAEETARRACPASQ